MQEFQFQQKYKEQATDTCPDCSMFCAELLTVHKYYTVTVIFNHKKRKLYVQENNPGQLRVLPEPDFLPPSSAHGLTLCCVWHRVSFLFLHGFYVSSANAAHGPKVKLDHCVRADTVCFQDQ